MMGITQRHILLLTLMAAACGSDDPRVIGGTTSDAGSPADGSIGENDAGVGHSDASVNSSGPIVQIVSPTTPVAEDLTADTIVVSDRILVRCRAETNPATGDRVDSSSVQVSIISADSSIESMATATTVPDEFEATLLLTAVPNGALSIVCTASDTSTEVRKNSHTIDTFLDLGPAIEFVAPLENTSYSGQTDVVFTVTESPVAAGDAAAAPNFDTVELSIAGIVIPDLIRDDNTFSASIQFDGPLFDPPLDGAQTLRVRAANTRSAEPVQRAKELLFNVDNKGPEISVVTPLPGQLVSGIIPIEANISDPTGIQEQSIVVTISGNNEVSLQNIGNGLYSGSFDTRVLGPTIFPNIIVRARDIAGNQSSTGYLIGLDNAPPIISLDSPSMRESKLKDGELICSTQFDPLGSDSINDGQGVLQLFEVRARLEDLSNAATSSSGVVVPVAHVDEDAVDLYLLDDENAALLVDTTGDGICDDVNPLLTPSSFPTTSNEVAVIQMATVPSTGSSFFASEETSLGPSFDDTGHAFCAYGEESKRPEPVCLSTPLTRVIQRPGAMVDAIYGIPPVEGLQCLGNAVDAIATNLADGWACLAVRGADNLGNQNVSPPVRICIDSDADRGEGCPTPGTISTAGAPNCTGTYNSDTQTVDTGTPCTVNLVFPPNEVRRIDL